MKMNAPMPVNELERLKNLVDLATDYSDLNEDFDSITALAAKIAGTEISLVNLVDAYTQWSIANYGLDVEQIAKEESICQYTILTDDFFEIENLAEDNRFSDKSYVNGELGLNYYIGYPLKTTAGHNIGALCFLDKRKKVISRDQKDMLKLIAKEIVDKLESNHTVAKLNNEIEALKTQNKRVAHDIRAPLSGIIGLSQVIRDEGINSNNLEDTFETVKLINQASSSLLDLTDEILTNDQSKQTTRKDVVNLPIIKSKLEKLFDIQAASKQVDLVVSIEQFGVEINFNKHKLLQIMGNVVANAIKFTPAGGLVKVHLYIEPRATDNLLKVEISDTGMGIAENELAQILDGKGQVRNGTDGEKSFGFGLGLVKNLIDGINGEMRIKSTSRFGTTFQLNLPIA